MKLALLGLDAGCGTSGELDDFEETEDVVMEAPRRSARCPAGASPAPAAPHGYLSWVSGRTSDDVEGLQRALVSAGCDVVGKYGRTYDEATRRAPDQPCAPWKHAAAADGNMGPRQSRLLFPADRYTVR